TVRRIAVLAGAISAAVAVSADTLPRAGTVALGLRCSAGGWVPWWRKLLASGVSCMASLLHGSGRDMEGSPKTIAGGGAGAKPHLLGCGWPAPLACCTMSAPRHGLTHR